MPYRGKPSKGCLTCRERKIRCDQRKGGCLNCEKSNRICPGYRDQLDLMFLDETKEVERKARRASLAPSRTSQTTPESTDQDPLVHKTLSAGDIPRTLTADLEGQATTFFFENFTVAKNVDRMSEMYISTSPTDKPGSVALIHSIRALGLAGLSRSADAPQLMRMAEGQYLNAIRAMNTALFDPEEAKDDKTLLAVMILIIFETFTNQENHDLAAWGNHIQGAAALLEARGTEQFQTRDGLRLFIQAAVPICTNCMQLNIPLPATISSLMAEALRVADEEDTSLRLLDHKLRFVTFYNKVRSREITELVQIIQQAKQLDDELVGLMKQLKEPWTYQTVPANPGEGVKYLGYCHVFEFFLGAECWNGTWASRLLLNQMMRSILLIGFASKPPMFLDQGYSKLFQETTDNLLQVQNDIIATVPQYFGDLPIAEDAKGKGKETLLQQRPPQMLHTSSGSKPLRFLWSHFSSNRPGASTHTPPFSGRTSPVLIPVIRTTGGANLPWMLFLLATTDIATEDIKSWVGDRLDEIGDEFGVQQSRVLAERLRSGKIDYAWYRNPWGMSVPIPVPVRQDSQTLIAEDIGEIDLA